MGTWPKIKGKKKTPNRIIGFIQLYNITHCVVCATEAPFCFKGSI